MEKSVTEKSLLPEPVLQAAQTAWLMGNCTADDIFVLGTKFNLL